MFNDIFNIIKLTDDKKSRMMPSKNIYNEDWLLLLIMNWFKGQDNFIINSDLDRKIVKGFKIYENSRCYTQLTIETQFKRRKKGVKDNLSEPSVKVSGVIGDITIKHKKIYDRALLNPETEQFSVFIVNMSDDLTKGKKNYPFYDQVSRTVGCIVQSMYKANIEFLDNVGLYILSMNKVLKSDTYKVFTDKINIEENVQKRIEQYGDDASKQEWFEYFKKVFQRMDVECIAWSDIVSFIKKNDSEYGERLEAFLKKCMLYM